MYVHRAHDTNHYIVVVSQEWKGNRINTLNGPRAANASQGVPRVTPAMLQNKGDIEISDIYPFVVTNGDSCDVEVIVFNVGEKNRVMQRVVSFPAACSVLTAAFPISIPTGGSQLVRVHFEPNRPGKHDCILSFQFHGFYIVRKATLTCTGDKKLQEKLRPTAPYVRKPRRKRHQGGPVVEGVKPEGRGGGLERRMAGYDMPGAVTGMGAASLKRYCQVLVEEFEGLRATIEPGFSEPQALLSAWKDKWQHLLFLEELALQSNQSMYDMDGVPMVTYGRHLELAVPGLAESRPSVLRGDSVRVRVLGRGDRSFRGYVHTVQERSVLVQFDRALHAQHTPGSRYDVEFELPRRTLRGMHQALELLGADEVEALHPTVPLSLDPFEENIQFPNEKLNIIQQRAVTRVLNVASSSKHHKPPYVIFGPPGKHSPRLLCQLSYSNLNLHCFCS